MDKSVNSKDSTNDSVPTTKFTNTFGNSKKSNTYTMNKEDKWFVPSSPSSMLAIPRGIANQTNRVKCSWSYCEWALGSWE
jgi:hypothetical protein